LQILRPRWTSLYHARKKQKSEACRLPALPDSLFGWIPIVYKITEEEVLASAGLDAYVFLAFFKMAVKYLAFLLFFALTVIYPVHVHFDPGMPGNEGKDLRASMHSLLSKREAVPYTLNSTVPTAPEGPDDMDITDWMWIYVVFTYLFSAFGMYLIIAETQKVIRVRQRYLSVQSSISDRTIRLSGIPAELRSEEKIKEMVENLEIGKVESVTLCKEWKELDDLIAERMNNLRRLEEAWSVHLGTSEDSAKMATRARQHNGYDGNDEHAGLMSGQIGSGAHTSTYSQPRPETRIWYGFLGLQSRKVDAIDYYEEKLRRLDERIMTARKKDYKATPLAFVTLDSAAACQMACQAIIDPMPMSLVAKSAPPPAGVVWQNTYLPRRTRMIRSWSVTALVLVLSIVWSFILLPIAGIQTVSNIRDIAPGIADFMAEHDIVASLINTGVPTLLISIFNVLVPYLYECKFFSQHHAVTIPSLTCVSRSFMAPRHDISRRHRDVRHLEELLLYILQSLHRLHHLGHRRPSEGPV